jgi:S-adenosylmethionine synthetase
VNVVFHSEYALAFRCDIKQESIEQCLERQTREFMELKDNFIYRTLNLLKEWYQKGTLFGTYTRISFYTNRYSVSAINL